MRTSSPIQDRGLRPAGPRTGMTLIELTLALGILATTVGGLIQILVNVSNGQEGLWNSQLALRTARNIADDVIQEPGDWEQVCTTYDAMPGVDVIVQDGDGDPASGWARITVRVSVPPDAGSSTREAALVFGRTR